MAAKVLHAIERLDDAGREAIQTNFELLVGDIDAAGPDFPITVVQGGTGLITVLTGDLLQGTDDDEISTLASVSAGSYLRSAGVDAANVWSTLKLPNAATTGDVFAADASNSMARITAVAAGRVLRAAGTSTLPAYSTFTIPDTFAQGDLPYASAANVLSGLAKSTTTTVYISNEGTSNGPSWAKVRMNNGVQGTLPVGNGGTGITAGNSGAVPYFNSGTTLISSQPLLANRLVLGGGAGTAPFTLGSLGTTTTILHGNAAGAPTFAAVTLTTDVTGVLPVANGGTGLAAGTSGGILGYTAAGTLASSAALAANQVVLGGGVGATPTTLGSLGTTTTVLHGNAAGAPTYATVSLSADVTGNLPVTNLNSGTSASSSTFWRGDATWAVPAATAADHNLLDGDVHADTVAQAVTRGSLISGNITPAWDELVIGAANRVLRSDGTDPSWAQVVLTTDVTGVLPVANGGTNASAASITAFNNITGFTAAGATGTTSTNLVFSTSPTLVTPVLGTPSSVTLTNATGLPVSTGISGLGTGVATWLATPSSANLASAVTGETGSGALVFGTNPTIDGPTLSNTLAGTYTIGGTPTLGATILGTMLFSSSSTTPHTVTSSATGVTQWRLLLTGNSSTDQGYISIRTSADSLETSFIKWPPGFSPTADWQSAGGTAVRGEGGAINLAATGASGTLGIYTGGATRRALVSSTGAWTWDAYGAGTLTTDASGNITAVSDVRLKDITGRFSRGLRSILALQPVQFRWTADSGFDRDNLYTGFVAQEVLAVMPEAVGQQPDQLYTIQDRVMIAALVNAVHELQDEMDTVRAAVGLSLYDRTTPLPTGRPVVSPPRDWVREQRFHLTDAIERYER